MTIYDKIIVIGFGVKNYYWDFDEYYWDHFMLATGYSIDKLLYNTTWGFQETRTFDALSYKGCLSGDTDHCFSFANTPNEYFACSVSGIKDQNGIALPIRLYADWEATGQIGLRGEIRSLVPGNSY